MKKLTFAGGSLALIGIITLTPVLTFAQVNINSEATGSLDAAVDTAATGSGASLETGVNAGMDAETTSSTTDDSANVSTNTDHSLSLRLNANGVAITSAAEVESEADLEVFAYNTAAADDMVDEAKAETTADGQSRIEVTYKHYGELFGFMPIVVKSTTVVTTGNGEVEVESSLPWWSFLATKKTHAAGEIESRIKDNPTVMMSAEMEASAEVQAEVMEAVMTELNAHTTLHTALNG